MPDRTEPLRVLIVDDDAAFRELLRLSLTEHDDLRVVAEAGDGEEAIQAAILHRPDVVTMDLEMPAKDGAEATRAIRQALPTTQVVIVTSSQFLERVSDARAAGASAFISKTRALAELHDALLATVGDGEFLVAL